MDFNETSGIRLAEERDISQGDDPAGADTAGGRHASSGGPNVASGDDNSQSHEDNSSSTGSRSISQKTGCRDPRASVSESTGQASGGEDDNSSDIELDLEFDDEDLWMETSAKVIKKLDDGLEVDDEEYEKVQKMLRGPQTSRQKAHFKTKRGRLEELDSFHENNPMPVTYTESSNSRYMSVDSLPEALGGETDRRGRLVYSPTSTWAYQAPLSPSGHAPPPSPWAYPLQLSSDWISLPPSPTLMDPSLSTASASPHFYSFSDLLSTNVSASVPPPSTYPVEPSSTVSTEPEPNSYFLSHQLFQKPSSNASANLPTASTSTGQLGSTASSRLGKKLTDAYMYASKASRSKNIWASEDSTLVSAILSNHFSDGGGEYGQPEAERNEFKGDVGKLHAARGWDDEEKRRTQEEWDEIASQMRKIPLNEKSLKEALVDLETLLQMFHFSLDMYRYFTKPPNTILEAFEMAYKIIEITNLDGKPEHIYNPTKEEESRLAKRLSLELLSTIPRYEDFPVAYMAGIEVPKQWFSHRFSNSSGLDRLGALVLSWVTPQRYEYRKQLRFCYVRVNCLALYYPYDHTTDPAIENPRLWDLLKQSAGPPYNPLPFKALRRLNPAVLNNFMIKFDSYVTEIKKIQWKQRSLIESLLNNRLEFIKYQFQSFEKDFDIVKAWYHEGIRGQNLLKWNQYINECAVNCVDCLAEIVEISQIGMSLLINYSDGWIFKMLDMNQMLRHKIPLFDLNIADKRPQQ